VVAWPRVRLHYASVSREPSTIPKHPHVELTGSNAKQRYESGYFDQSEAPTEYGSAPSTENLDWATEEFGLAGYWSG
jgi:hypothetical protein